MHAQRNDDAPFAWPEDPPLTFGDVRPDGRRQHENLLDAGAGAGARAESSKHLGKLERFTSAPPSAAQFDVSIREVDQNEEADSPIIAAVHGSTVDLPRTADTKGSPAGAKVLSQKEIKVLMAKQAFTRIK